MASESREKLRKTLYVKKLLTDLENMTDPVSTTMLEVLDALKIVYLPKETFFDMRR